MSEMWQERSFHNRSFREFRQRDSAPANSPGVTGSWTTSEIPDVTRIGASKSRAEGVTKIMGRLGAISCNAAANSRAELVPGWWHTSAASKRARALAGPHPAL